MREQSARVDRRALVPAVVLMSAFLGACVIALPAVASEKTTAPGSAYRINVMLTDTSIKIERDRYTGRDGTTRYPRGAIIDFIVKNGSVHAHPVRLKLLTQHYFSKYEQPIVEIPVGKKPIQPGAVSRLAINFYYRGSFALQLMAGAQVRASAPIIIF